MSPESALFGESLGPHTSEDVFVEEGIAGLHRVDVDWALFLGTLAQPRSAGSSGSRPEAMGTDGEVVEVDYYREYFALPEDVRARGGASS